MAKEGDCIKRFWLQYWRFSVVNCLVGELVVDITESSGGKVFKGVVG